MHSGQRTASASGNPFSQSFDRCPRARLFRLKNLKVCTFGDGVSVVVLTNAASNSSTNLRFSCPPVPLWNSSRDSWELTENKKLPEENLHRFCSFDHTSRCAAGHEQK